MKHFKLTSESKVNSFGVNLLKSNSLLIVSVGKGRRQRRMDWEGRKPVCGNAWSVPWQCGGVWQCVGVWQCGGCMASSCLAMRWCHGNAEGVWQCVIVYQCVGVWQCVGVYGNAGVSLVMVSSNALGVWRHGVSGNALGGSGNALGV